MKAEQIFDQVQENIAYAQESLSHLVKSAKPMADNVIKKSKEFYEDARERLPENAEKYAVFAAAGLSIGFVAYTLGKKKVRSESVSEKISDTSAEVKKTMKPTLNDYIAPALKFVKLFMFYRLSH